MGTIGIFERDLLRSSVVSPRRRVNSFLGLGRDESANLGDVKLVAEASGEGSGRGYTKEVFFLLLTVLSVR